MSILGELRHKAFRIPPASAVVVIDDGGNRLAVAEVRDVTFTEPTAEGGRRVTGSELQLIVAPHAEGR